MQTEPVKVIWVTPDAEKHLVYMARVSNPSNQDKYDTGPKLIKYLIEHKHWSPFEMINACVEINTTRDIGRQILRHRSFVFQEFSQRYADVNKLEKAPHREARLQDNKNRQNSISTEDTTVQAIFNEMQDRVLEKALECYQDALNRGIAKEQARCFLPEGLTMSRMYMSGSLRSWIHYLQVRLDKSTQKEHRLIAEQIKQVLKPTFQQTFEALNI